MPLSHVSFNSVIVNLYGEVWQNKIRQFARLRTKRTKLECHLRYVEKCREHGVVPKFMRVKPVKCIREYEKFFEMMHNKLLVKVIREHRRNIAIVESELFSLHIQLSRTLRPDLWEVLDSMTYSRAQVISDKMLVHHGDKVKRLTQFARQHTVETNCGTGNNYNSVVNLSSQNISANLQRALSRGLNFAPSPHKLPVETIITGIEETIMRNKIPQQEAECLRQDVAVLMRKSKLPKGNISKSEITALKEIRENPDLLVLPADKGNATVIVDTVMYQDKITQLVSDTTTYKQVNYNPTSRVTSGLDKLLRALSDEDLRTQLRPMNPTPPKIYGLPKVHKPNWPLRPIVSQIDSPTYKTSRYMAEILQPLTGKTASFVKDSLHFVHLLKDVRLSDEEIMVSFDVASLFTNVPVADSIQIITDLSNKTGIPTGYISLIEYCLNTGFFVWRGDYYRQIDGVAMGSPIAPVVANIFMEWFEEKALSTAQNKPRHWWRYVDDVFAILRREDEASLLNHLNSVHPRIVFTTEREKDGSLAFLDVLVRRNIDGRLNTAVYRKPTHTDRYLRADSHHHPSHLASVPRTLINRAYRLCDPQHLHTELDHVRRVLESNGYTWRHSLRLSANNKIPVNTVNRVPAFLPFVKGVTDKIGFLLRRKYCVNAIFRPVTQMKQLLRSPKDSDPLNVPGVYSIPCECGKAYVGETRRNIKTRLLEHIRCVKKLDRNGSAIAEHILDSDATHFIRFDKAKVISKEKAWIPRKIREAIEIGRRPNFNRDQGWTLPSTWKPVLKCVPDSFTSTEDVISSLHSCDDTSTAHVPTNCCIDPTPAPTISSRAARATARSARRAAVTHESHSP